MVGNSAIVEAGQVECPTRRRAQQAGEPQDQDRGDDRAHARGGLRIAAFCDACHLARSSRANTMKCVTSSAGALSAEGPFNSFRKALRCRLVSRAGRRFDAPALDAAPDNIVRISFTFAGRDEFEGIDIAS